jgi:hypothetical protein
MLTSAAYTDPAKRELLIALLSILILRREKL